MRVYEQNFGYFACNYRTERRFELETSLSQPDRWPNELSTGGRFVSYVESYSSSAGLLEILHTVDTRAGREVHYSAQRSDGRLGVEPVPGEENEFVTDVAQSRSGAVAWIVRSTTHLDCPPSAPGNCDRVTREVRTLRRDRVSRYAVRDESPTIDETSLVLRGTTIAWRNAGQRVSQTLR